MTKKRYNDPLIGRRLGDYLIQELMGRGGMARVYRGLDENLGRPAAIKVLEIRDDDAEDSRLVDRFKLEARAIAGFDHPNIITIYQYGETDSLFFIAMKLVQGSTLSQLLRQMRRENSHLSPERVLQIIHDVCSALDYAHARGIIHRDVKPSNILFDASANNRAVLTDFGLAMELGGNSTLGTAFGTPRYISPEQAVSSLQAVPQSDFYSLGIILFEMLTGQVPFQDESPMSIALYHITSEPPHPRDLNPDIPAEVEAVVLKALEKDPEDRYSSGREFYRALEEAYISADVSLGTPVIAPEKLEAVKKEARAADASARKSRKSKSKAKQKAARRSESPPQRRRRWLIFLPLAGVLAVVALVFVLALGGTGGAGEANGSSGVTPSLTPGDGPILQLVYDERRFAIYNPNAFPVDVDDMRLVQGRVNYDGSNFQGPIPPRECAWIRLLDDVTATRPEICGNMEHSLHLLNDPEEKFWALRPDGTDSFRVLVNGQEVQVCTVDAGRCDVPLP